MNRRNFLKSFGLGLVAIGVTAAVGESLIEAVGKTLLMPASEIAEVSAMTFQQMLNEYLPVELLREEMMKRDFMLAHLEKDDSFKGGHIAVPLTLGEDDAL